MTNRGRLVSLTGSGCTIKADFGKYGKSRISIPIPQEIEGYEVKMVEDAKNEQDMETLEITIHFENSVLTLEACTFYQGKEGGYGCELKEKGIF